MSGAVVVPIAEAHVPGYHACVDRVAREGKYLAFLQALPLEKSREFVLNNIACGNPHFVALVDDKVVGWCDICRIERPVYIHGGVLGMGIVEGHRGKGLGLALITAALDQARTSGFTRVELTVYEGNDRAHALYRKAGFVEEGVKRKVVKLEGRYRDATIMAILFGDAQ